MEDDTTSPLIAKLGEARYRELLAEAEAVLYESVPCAAEDCPDRNNPMASGLPLCVRHLAQAGTDHADWVQKYVLTPDNRVVVDDAGYILDDTMSSPAQWPAVVRAGEVSRTVHLRLASTELFDVDDQLQSHIELVRSTFGDPKQFMGVADVAWSPQTS